jgi:hypothetical protein
MRLTDHSNRRARAWCRCRWLLTVTRAGLKPGHYKERGKSRRSAKKQPRGVEDQKSSHEKIKIRTLKTVGCGTRPVLQFLWDSFVYLEE